MEFRIPRPWLTVPVISGVVTLVTKELVLELIFGSTADWLKSNLWVLGDFLAWRWSGLALGLIILVGVWVLGIAVVPRQAASPGESDNSHDSAALERLRAEAKALAAQIREFLGDRIRDDPSRTPHWFGLPKNASEERRHRAFEESSRVSSDYSSETMSRFDARYKDQALRLFDDAAQRGLVETHERHLFQYPTNRLGIEEVASILGVIGEGGKWPSRSGSRKSDSQNQVAE